MSRYRRIRGPAGPGSRATSGGFTLLEMLLAFMVFAISFTIVLEIMSGSIRNTVRAREYTEAALTAQSVMDQVGLEIPLEAGISQAGESGDYRWRVEVFEYVDTGENTYSVELAELTNIELLEVELEVSWGEPPREQAQYFRTVKALTAGLDRRNN